MKIAILGATSQIAKNLIVRFCKNPMYELSLFARRPDCVKQFVSSIETYVDPLVAGFGEFCSGGHDTIINCVGITNPTKQKIAALDFFMVTERFDNLVIDYLQRHDRTRYINFSSGAVYGTVFESGVNDNSISEILVNCLTSADSYRIAKLAAEAKHRSVQNRCIIDLRVFSFFSRYIDLGAGFMLCEIIRCLKDSLPFRTNTVDIVRDYVSPKDLFDLVELCLTGPELNTALDVYSSMPVHKSNLLEFFSREFGLRVEREASESTSAAGTKLSYYSTSRKSFEELGYSPQLSSLEALSEETIALLKQ